MAENEQPVASIKSVPVRPFRRAVLRGLAIVLPPLLTVVIFVWIWSTIDLYVMKPVKKGTQLALVYTTADIQKDIGEVDDPVAKTKEYEGQVYKKLEKGEFVPVTVYQEVEKNLGDRKMPVTGVGVYKIYVDERYLSTLYRNTSLFIAVYFVHVLVGQIYGGRHWQIFLGDVRRRNQEVTFG